MIIKIQLMCRGCKFKFTSDLIEELMIIKNDLWAYADPCPKCLEKAYVDGQNSMRGSPPIC